MVLEQHRNVTGMRVVSLSQTAQEKARHAHRFVAVATIGPGAVAVHQQDLVAGGSMRSARFDLRAECQRCVENQWVHRHTRPPSTIGVQVALLAGSAARCPAPPRVVPSWPSADEPRHYTWRAPNLSAVPIASGASTGSIRLSQTQPRWVADPWLPRPADAAPPVSCGGDRYPDSGGAGAIALSACVWYWYRVGRDWTCRQGGEVIMELTRKVALVTGAARGLG